MSENDEATPQDGEEAEVEHALGTGAREEAAPAAEEEQDEVAAPEAPSAPPPLAD